MNTAQLTRMPLWAYALVASSGPYSASSERRSYKSKITPALQVALAQKAETIIIRDRCSASFSGLFYVWLSAVQEGLEKSAALVGQCLRRIALNRSSLHYNLRPGFVRKSHDCGCNCHLASQTAGDIIRVTGPGKLNLSPRPLASLSCSYE
ncbi:hypothetical protein [Hydrogenophaga sp.]|uniref:hypothetical protein n=1 Tax=Hydrogenophaga sp. TaxID=1904254 RepID=UPI002639141C|nr:hypothetical protein [Hydrogenophaga sp.]